jgi:hypothetical protein
VSGLIDGAIGDIEQGLGVGSNQQDATPQEAGSDQQDTTSQTAVAAPPS